MVRHVREGATYSFDVMKANEKNDDDAAASFAMNEVAPPTLTAPSDSRTGVLPKRLVKASEMAAQEIDRLDRPIST